MATKEEKNTYRERKAAEWEGAAANMVTDEAEDKAMVTEMTSKTGSPSDGSSTQGAPATHAQISLSSSVTESMTHCTISG